MQDSIQPTPHTVTEIPEPLPELTVENELQLSEAEGTVLTEQTVRKQKDTPVAMRVKARKEVPQYLAYPYVGSPADFKGVPIKTVPPEAKNEDKGKDQSIEMLSADSISIDSIPTDTLVAGEIKEGLVLVDPAAEYRGTEGKENVSVPDWGMSWIYLGLALIFCVIGVKFRGNKKYVKALMSDLTDTRVRHNAFDETVRETSLLVLLNLLWIACAGILLWVLVNQTVRGGMETSISILQPPERGLVLCMGVAAVYQILIFTAYWLVGNVFSDRAHTRVWLKGAGASTGLTTLLLFPLALLALNYSNLAVTMLIISAIVFVIGKIVFIYKGFRIFFNQISSWMLFLYYLCSLEIVPLILTYVTAVTVCTAEL